MGGMVRTERRVEETVMQDGRKERGTGTFLGVPYDWRRKGFVSRLRQRWWNPDDPRLFTPKTFGWGYDINLARLRRLKPGS